PSPPPPPRFPPPQRRPRRPPPPRRRPGPTPRRRARRPEASPSLRVAPRRGPGRTALSGKRPPSVPGSAVARSTAGGRARRTVGRCRVAVEEAPELGRRPAEPVEEQLVDRLGRRRLGLGIVLVQPAEVDVAGPGVVADPGHDPPPGGAVHH